MLEKIDLCKSLKKNEAKEILSELEIRLAALQREAIALKIPIVILFEGWSASGKGRLINRLINSLDPRYFSVYSILKPTEEEFFRPFLCRFWIKTPAKGRMAIFDRSWYGRVLADRVNQNVTPEQWKAAYQEINSFERQLSNDGAIIIKFFLHISKKVQKKRFQHLEKNKATAWRVTEDDWEKHRNYEKFLHVTEEMLSKTETGNAPWAIIEANDFRFAMVKMFQESINILQNKIEKVKAQKEQHAANNMMSEPISVISTSALEQIDLSIQVEKEDYYVKLKKYQARIRDLEHQVYQSRVPVVIVYEGWDAAGKGGNIKRLTRKMDPRGYEVIPVAAPNELEIRHHYLWRFWQEMPKAGHIAIFDRSWYGRVMVERVEGFCSEAEWRRAYHEINEMEEQLAHFDTVVVKLWLHISKEEQLRRFEERKNNPNKNWKITDDDWRNREKWDAYLEAVNEMLYRTSTPYAPWTIIESNDKLHARLKALKTVIFAIEEKLHPQNAERTP